MKNKNKIVPDSGLSGCVFRNLSDCTQPEPIFLVLWSNLTRILCLGSSSFTLDRNFRVRFFRARGAALAAFLDQS